MREQRGLFTRENLMRLAVPRSLILSILIAALPALAGGSAPRCKLGSDGKRIDHVVYIQFDNTHLRRDRAAVPSDLEQMPHLLDFMRENGTVLTNDHTVLISHTAVGILSTLTGVYPDRHGQTVSNSYVRTSATGSFSFPSSFGYWTDPVDANAGVPNMVTPDGLVPPAPWVPYTRAGCDVGAVASANMVLENTGTSATGDMTKVFGVNSPQWNEAKASSAAGAGTAARNKAQTDFVGLALHCAQGSAACSGGQDDLLPQEPGGYTGFKGLFGAQEINPFLTGGPVLNDFFGVPINDPFGQPGFPGFDGMEANVSLSYIAAMLEHGVQVTFAYISDAHDFHGVAGNAHEAFGPGSAGYVQQLKSYDEAFAAFFARLKKDGITRENTLFVFTVDEGDHFVGGSPTSVACDGVNVPCDWTNQVGEIQANIDLLVAHQFPTLGAEFLNGSASPYAFTVHGDDAPTFYLAKKGAGALGQTDPVTRDFERNMADLTAVNPYTHATDKLLVQMADQTGMKALHMFTTGDPVRNATFVYFADANYFLTDFPSNTCETCIGPAFAWNHGDIQPEIAHTWVGFVGPGVRRLGSAAPWTDHTDVRPTMLTLLGLKDTYVHDGRVITQILSRHGEGRGHDDGGDALEALGAAYKQLNAPFGRFGKQILRASTAALRGDDSTYATLESEIASITERRDALASEIRAALDAEAFQGQSTGERQARRWIDRAEDLIEEAGELTR